MNKQEALKWLENWNKGIKEGETDQHEPKKVYCINNNPNNCFEVDKSLSEESLDKANNSIFEVIYAHSGIGNYRTGASAHPGFIWFKGSCKGRKCEKKVEEKICNVVPNIKCRKFPIESQDMNMRTKNFMFEITS